MLAAIFWDDQTSQTIPKQVSRYKSQKRMTIRLFFLILIIPTISNSQNMVSGTVVDKTTRTPIELVTVGVVKKGIGTNH
jgi:hypothetical protein